jgi:hypothetical protein
MYSWFENILIEVRNENGIITDTTQHSNKIMDVGLNWLADALRSTAFTPKITYMGVGTTNTAITSTQIALSSETFRKLITNQTTGAVGVVNTITYIAPSEALGTIAELGWFAGTSATVVAGTGCMISRYLYAHTKTALESITVTRTDTFTAT